MDNEKELLLQREEELAEREAQLKQKEEELKELEEVVYKNAKERLYDKIHIPIWLLDVIIFGCLAGVILIFLLKSNF